MLAYLFPRPRKRTAKTRKQYGIDIDLKEWDVSEFAGAFVGESPRRLPGVVVKFPPSWSPKPFTPEDFEQAQSRIKRRTGSLAHLLKFDDVDPQRVEALKAAFTSFDEFPDT